ncbi:MAG: hypothetical protein K0S37_762 [Microbacterium sp.]|jgi:hypothetical protein|nr:hypothetical protein [Microbacterium sp.]
MGDRIKVIGYYTPDDPNHFDPDHPSGLTAEGQDEAHERLMSLEEIAFEAE